MKALRSPRKALRFWRVAARVLQLLQTQRL
nr:MAG TPA: hypothetical protein [Caudoviricetes sp.]